MLSQSKVVKPNQRKGPGGRGSMWYGDVEHSKPWVVDDNNWGGLGSTDDDIRAEGHPVEMVFFCLCLRESYKRNDLKLKQEEPTLTQ